MTVTMLKMAAAGDDTINPDELKVSFDDFWRAYPRRVARKAAQVAWQKIAPEQYPQIIEALARQKKTDDWRRSSGQFIPYPASYLNGERWTDELEADLTMGQCHWNINGNRGREPRCTDNATVEKNRVVYCKRHGDMVN